VKSQKKRLSSRELVQQGIRLHTMVRVSRSRARRSHCYKWYLDLRRRLLVNWIRRSLVTGLHLFLCLWLLSSEAAQASPLSERLAQFPNWQSKPLVQVAKGDLVYPDWFAGNWTVTTTLVDLAAPLTPAVTTPGFDSNRAYLNQPITFQVRFVPASRLTQDSSPRLVSDRAFNGLSLAKAYLGDRPVLSVKVDPTNPNRQITLLRGDRQLVSTVTRRAIEVPEPGRLLTTEVFQQEFRGTSQLYFNEVETTTAYQQQNGVNPAIVADQVTAIYLSPQDADYFKARNQPVALYRYRLEFSPEHRNS
jgi:hypothetical protein